MSEAAEIFFERNFRKQDRYDRADAILNCVLQIPASQSLLVLGQLEVVKNKKEFSLTPKINFQLIDLKTTGDQTLENISFKLSSISLTVCEIREYVDSLVDNYLIMKKNNLGNKTYFFDHIIEKTSSRVTTPKKVMFSKYPFITNRNLDNVFHERQEELKQRVEFFMNRKDWYDKRGVPHTLGLLFTGQKGGGKSSEIKAIANVTNRHIVNINLSTIKTSKQLKKLFYDERLDVCENMDDTNNTKLIEYIIPIDKRVYVIEDIDAMDSDLLLKRSSKNPTMTLISDTIKPPKQSNMTFSNDMEEANTQNDLDLATVLNVIDGTLETPGRILIITTNYPEKLDEAFVRPGRIDMIIEFKKANHKLIRDMFYSYYDVEPDPKLISEIKEYNFTPAEVAQILFKNFGKPDRALQDLISIDPKKYFFSD